MAAIFCLVAATVASASACPATELASSGVVMLPGAMQLTLMSYSARAIAADLLAWITAALEAR